MKKFALIMLLGSVALIGCKKNTGVDLGMELESQLTILELEWKGNTVSDGKIGTLGVPIRLTNPTEETVQVSNLNLEIHAKGERRCSETKALERTIEPGGKIKMRIDVECQWSDIGTGFEANGTVSVDSENGEPATLTISQSGLRVHN
jgi:hypothetical protein